MYSLKGYILPFHRLSFHRIPFYMSLSSLQTKSVKVGMFNGKELFWQLWCFLVEYQIIELPFRDEKANGVTFDWVPFYSLPTLFEQSINHYFRSCTFAYWELCLIVFSWEPFCLVPFHAVPNNRTAILVCPFWKAVDFFVNKLWRCYGCIQTTDFNFWINSNSKMACFEFPFWLVPFHAVPFDAVPF